MKGEIICRVPIVEGKSLRRFFPASPLRKTQSQVLLVALRVARQDSVEADNYRWFTGFKILTLN